MRGMEVNGASEQTAVCRISGIEKFSRRKGCAKGVTSVTVHCMVV